MLFERIGDEEQLVFEANVPALVTRLTRKCPGYSSGGRRSGKARGEAVYWELGVRPPRYS